MLRTKSAPEHAVSHPITPGKAGLRGTRYEANAGSRHRTPDVRLLSRPTFLDLDRIHASQCYRRAGKYTEKPDNAEDAASLATRTADHVREYKACCTANCDRDREAPNRGAKLSCERMYAGIHSRIVTVRGRPALAAADGRCRALR